MKNEKTNQHSTRRCDERRSGGQAMMTTTCKTMKMTMTQWVSQEL